MVANPPGRVLAPAVTLPSSNLIEFSARLTGRTTSLDSLSLSKFFGHSSNILSLVLANHFGF